MSLCWGMLLSVQVHVSKQRPREHRFDVWQCGRTFYFCKTSHHMLTNAASHKKIPIRIYSQHFALCQLAFSPNLSSSLRWPVSDAYEASLLHHYIIHCTNWIDVCDSRHHFEKEVPRRAAHFPGILNVILGLAARYLWLMGKVPVDHSQPYVDQCLLALIVAHEDPLAHSDENFLVAVILLRLHEEMGDADEQYHHFGI
jgi:hypothetical protein